MAAEATVAEAEAARPTLSGASWLPVIQTHLDPCLVQPSVLEGLRPLCDTLPGAALYALEIRLAATSRQVDLSCRIAEPEPARRLADQPVAGSAARLLRNWHGLEAGRAVSEIWLEYDLPEPVASGGPPDPPPLHHSKPWRGPIACLRLRKPPNHAQVLSLLAESTDAVLSPHLEPLMVAIEPPLHLLYVFELSARGSAGVRLEIYTEALPPLIEYLERYLPPGSARRIGALEPLLGDADRFHLSFDVLPGGISPRLGLEASYRRLPHREPRWAGLLDRLEAAGLCTEAERRGIDRWPGTDRATTSATWPVGAEGFCVRCLSHVKVVSMPEQPPRAKIYILFQNVSPRHGHRGDSDVAAAHTDGE